MRVKNPKVRDAVRVPRVVGTRRRVSVMVEAFTTARKARPVDELANRILPYTRTELRDLRVQKALRKEQKPLRTLPEGLPRLSMGGRLTDLQALKELRWFGRPMPDSGREARGVGRSGCEPPLLVQQHQGAVEKAESPKPLKVPGLADLSGATLLGASANKG